MIQKKNAGLGATLVVLAAVSLTATTSAQGAASTLGNPDSWCKQQSALLAGKKPNTALIAEEFKVANLESLQDEFIDKLARPSTSKAFVAADYWRSSFETVKVRALYDSFLAFPEPDILAILIEMSRKASDAQEKNDARMALAFIHCQTACKTFQIRGGNSVQ